MSAEVDDFRSDSFEDALLALYTEHAKVLVEMLWVYVGDRAEAEDLTQEAFIRVQRAWPHLDRGANIGGYLRTTAFNLARSEFRRRAVRLRHVATEAPEAAAAEEEAMLSNEQAEVVAALRSLSSVRQRECLVLRYWDDLKPPDIANTLGLSENTVKTHLVRGLANLKDRLKVQTT